MFQGLASSQQGIEELVFMPENGDVGVRPCVFDVKKDTLSNMVDSFSKLKKLKLDLPQLQLIIVLTRLPGIVDVLQKS